MTGDRLDVNYVANYIRPGPNSNPKRGIIVFTDTADAAYYVRDNVVEGNKSVTHNNELLFDRTEFQGRKLVTVAKKPFPVAEVKTTSAAKAFDDVLRNVGATLPRRDSVDSRIIQNVIDRTGRIIDTTDQVGGWPEYKTGPIPSDSDDDGIPDEWEIKHHLNPKDPSDASKDSADGYTNIEKYINSIGR
jgi:hypothetical protein